MAFLDDKEDGLILPYDPETVQAQSYDLLPEGPTPFVLAAIEVKATKDNEGRYVKIEHVVSDGPAKGRRIWKNFNIQNKSATATEIGRAEIEALKAALGVPKAERDLGKLRGLEVIGIVRTRPASGQYEAQSEIKSYRPTTERTTLATTATREVSTSEISKAAPARGAPPKFLR